MLELLQNFNLVYWLQTVGYLGLILVVFTEMGLFFGFFLPGDSLVFTAGILAAKSIFNIWVLILILVTTAFIGYIFGYWFGNKLGFWLLKRKQSIFFKQEYVNAAHSFYQKHGGKALILGRMVPIVRTFTPIIAGMVSMPYKSYTIYNFLGAVIWGGGITVLGFFVGGLLPNAAHYLLPAILIIVFLSILPGVIHYVREKKRGSNRKKCESSE